MPEIGITVIDRVARPDVRDVWAVCGNSDYTITWSLDAEWSAAHIRTAVFVWRDRYTNHSVPVIFEGTSCPMPAIPDALVCAVGLWASVGEGEDHILRTTSPAMITMRRSSTADTDRPVITQDVYDELLAAVNAALDAPVQAATEQAAIAAGHAEDAANSASAAAGSATAAAESAASASASKTAAAGSASAAHEDSAAAIAAKNAAETAQGIAEEARDTAVSAKNAAETAQRKAETAQGKSETAKTAAEAAAQSATGSASSASVSATAAGSSATSAAGSASAAHTDAAAALEAKNTAVSAKDTAVASKIAAEAARGAAENAATNASGSATAAANSATAAANSATAAAASAATAAEVEARAEEVAGSIPEDYSELSGDVADLKSAFDVSAYHETAESDGGTDMYAPLQIHNALPAKVKNLTVKLDAIQAGSGDPSPDNVRAISGWSSIYIKVGGGNYYDPSQRQNGYYLNNNGTISSKSGEQVTGLINIHGISTLQYVFYNPAPGARAHKIAYYRADGSFISLTAGTNVAKTSYKVQGCTIPDGAEYIRISTPTTNYLFVLADYTVPQYTFSPAVYGGELDVTNGKLTVTSGYIASYNGEELPGRWISSMDVYAEGTVPTTGAQVVYDLAEPVVSDVAAYDFTLSKGDNIIQSYASLPRMAGAKIEYQIATDKDLILEDIPADAKAVGKEIADLNYSAGLTDAIDFVVPRCYYWGEKYHSADNYDDYPDNTNNAYCELRLIENIESPVEIYVDDTASVNIEIADNRADGYQWVKRLRFEAGDRIRYMVRYNIGAADITGACLDHIHMRLSKKGFDSFISQYTCNDGYNNYNTSYGYFTNEEPEGAYGDTFNGNGNGMIWPAYNVNNTTVTAQTNSNAELYAHLMTCTGATYARVSVNLNTPSYVPRVIEHADFAWTSSYIANSGRNLIVVDTLSPRYDYIPNYQLKRSTFNRVASACRHGDYYYYAADNTDYDLRKVTVDTRELVATYPITSAQLGHANGSVLIGDKWYISNWYDENTAAVINLTGDEAVLEETPFTLPVSSYYPRTDRGLIYPVSDYRAYSLAWEGITEGATSERLRLVCWHKRDTASWIPVYEDSLPPLGIVQDICVSGDLVLVPIGNRIDGYHLVGMMIYNMTTRQTLIISSTQRSEIEAIFPYNDSAFELVNNDGLVYILCLKNIKWEEFGKLYISPSAERYMAGET